MLRVARESAALALRAQDARGVLLGRRQRRRQRDAALREHAERLAQHRGAGVVGAREARELPCLDGVHGRGVLRRQRRPRALLRRRGHSDTLLLPKGHRSTRLGLNPCSGT